jgi:tetratricopeptide (TPR) repeat protein
MLISIPASAATWPAYLHNRTGLKHLGDKAYYPAYQEFLKALESDPLNPDVQMNLGLTFEANEEYGKAEQAYRGALELVPEKSPLRFEALFNLAGALAKQKKIDAALAAYQACLEINPDSIEVKTNIELLWQGGQGQGKGDQDDKNQKKGQDNKDQDQKRGRQSEKDQPEQQPRKQQPKPFQSQDLSKEDVKRILDEIKNQEQAIRAEEYQKGPKEAPRGKDW